MTKQQEQRLNMDKYRLTEVLDNWYVWFVEMLNRNPDKAENNAIASLLDKQISEVLRIQAEEIAEATPEKVREDLIELLKTPPIIREKVSVLKRGKIHQEIRGIVNFESLSTKILNAIQPLIEQAKREGRKEAYYDIHADLMSVDCKDSYESMHKRVEQLLDKVHEIMISKTL